MSATKNDNKPEEQIPLNNSDQKDSPGTSEHKNVFYELFEAVYKHTKPVPPEYRVVSPWQHQRVIFRVMDPELTIYVASKGQKDTTVCIDLPGKFRVGPVVCPRGFVEQDYLTAFECLLPPDWENRDLGVTQYLGNVRQIVEEERGKSN